MTCPEYDGPFVPFGWNVTALLAVLLIRGFPIICEPLAQNFLPRDRRMSSWPEVASVPDNAAKTDR